MPIEENDHREGYCRMLGHHVPFIYCRAQTNGQPCRKILDCWFEKFDIRSFLCEHFTEAQIDALQIPPQPKMATLVELIEKAKKNC